MRKVLTDTLLRSLQSAASSRVELADAKCAGLTMRVTPAGGKSWSFRFRDPRSGRTSISCAGHASVAHETKPKLTSYPDHSVGADQIAKTARNFG
jgi:hypothetical protein